MSKVKYVIDENVEQDGANYGTLGQTFVHRERSTLGVSYLHTLLPVRKRERERENFIEINRKHDDTCTNKNYNEGLCGLIQGDLR